MKLTKEQKRALNIALDVLGDELEDCEKYAHDYPNEDTFDPTIKKLEFAIKTILAMKGIK